MAKETQQFVTPVGIANFVQIVEPHKEGDNKGRYTLDIFVKKEDWKPSGDILAQAVEAELASKTLKFTSKDYQPIEKVSDLPDDKKGYVPEELHDCIRIRMKANGDIKGTPNTIHCVDSTGKELTPIEKAAIKNGSLVQASVSLYAGKHSGKTFCRVSLSAVMYLGESDVSFPQEQFFKAKALSAFDFSSTPAFIAEEAATKTTTEKFFDD